MTYVLLVIAILFLIVTCSELMDTTPHGYYYSLTDPFSLVSYIRSKRQKNMQISIKLDADWSPHECSYNIDCPELRWISFNTIEQAKEIAEQIVTELERELLETEFITLPSREEDYASALFDKATILCDSEFSRIQSEKDNRIFVEISTTWIKSGIFCLTLPVYLCAVHYYDAEYESLLQQNKISANLKKNTEIRNFCFTKAKHVGEKLLASFEEILKNIPFDEDLKKWR